MVIFRVWRIFHHDSPSRGLLNCTPLNQPKTYKRSLIFWLIRGDVFIFFVASIHTSIQCWKVLLFFSQCTPPEGNVQKFWMRERKKNRAAFQGKIWWTSLLKKKRRKKTSFTCSNFELFSTCLSFHLDRRQKLQWN